MCKKSNRDAEENWEGNPVNTKFTRIYFLNTKQSTGTELTEHNRKNLACSFDF